MTRGYLVLANTTGIKKVCYLENSAYPEYFGVKILESIKKGKIKEFIDEQDDYIHSCYDEDLTKGFEIEWIKRTRKNKDWDKYEISEYGYLYKEKQDSLSVYNYGKLICTFHPLEDYEKYNYIFKNWNALVDELIFDKDKMRYVFSKEKDAIKKIFSLSLSELESLYISSRNEKMVLDDTHVCLPGSSANYKVYRKRLSFSESLCYLDFIVEKYNNQKWNILVQLPYERVFVEYNFSSEKKAVEYIRNLVKGNEETVRSLAKLTVSISEAYVNNRYAELEQMIETLSERYEKEPWFMPNGHFSVKEISSHYNYSKAI